MSGENAPGSSSAPITGPQRKSGFRTVYAYTGLPESWLSKRPKLPSRNWLIFLGVVSTVTGAYIYDRRQCKKIRQEYVDKVKHLSEAVPDDHLEKPRRVTVYGAKWPGDEDYDQSAKHFRKYVKPILVAAAIEYDIIKGKKHGDIANHVAEEVRKRRRLDEGLDRHPSREELPPTYPYKTLAEVRQKELEGGIVIVGRPTWKEFMCGLKRGWSSGLDFVDRDELLARQLADDGKFDEPLDPMDETQKQESTLDPPPVSLFPFQTQNTSANAVPLLKHPTQARIPPLPPILFVSFTDYIGFRQIPIMFWDWFNQRKKVQAGAEAAYRLVMNQTRPFALPTSSTSGILDTTDPSSPTTVTEFHGGDLDFDLQAEEYYRKSLDKLPSNVQKERRDYYRDLPKRLKTARELARGMREPTKDEEKNPPPTEVELAAERLEKEKRWQRALEGREIVRGGKPVEWDEMMDGCFVLFVDPPRDE